MKKSCRIELYKGIHNRMFYVALGSGIAMILAQVVQTFLTVSKNLPSTMGNKGAEAYGLLYRFIGVETETLGHKLFFMSIPILISLATAWIFFEEKEEGYFGYVNQEATVAMNPEVSVEGKMSILAQEEKTFVAVYQFSERYFNKKTWKNLEEQKLWVQILGEDKIQELAV